MENGEVVKGSEGLVVIVWYKANAAFGFYCDLCEETFNSEDDLENRYNAKHPNQRLVVIACQWHCHPDRNPGATALSVFYIFYTFYAAL